tara:strand:+ start:4255 stop:6321 length:2067 start_codon:yes stop_codon:yes gene_type:complete
VLRSNLARAVTLTTLTFTTLLAPVATQAKATQAKLRGTLPASGTVGDAPSANTYAIELHQNGLLSVAGVPVTFDECFQQLAAMTLELPNERIGSINTSVVNVLIRADRSVPMASIDRMLRECARRDIAAPRIFFGVTHADSGDEGAFAYFLPIDQGVNKGGVEVIPITALPGKDGSIDGLHSYLQRYAAAMQPAQRKAAAVNIQAQGDLAWGTALSMLDAAVRAGIPSAYIECTLTAAQNTCWHAKTTKRDLRALQLSSPTSTEVGCQIGPVTVRSGAKSVLPARVRGAFAGYPSSPAGLAVEEIEIVEEVVDTDVNLDLNSGIPSRYGNRSIADSGKHTRPLQSQAIDDGLKWLASHQDDDGKWDSDGFMKHDLGAEICDGAGNPVHDVGVTGLALLALLGDGNTMRVGPYRDQVKMAVKWLRSQQQNHGLFGSSASHDFIYDHAIAAYAMVEAYGLSDYKLIKKSAQKAINYLESHRNAHGVWRYRPRDGDNDTSVTNWCAMAYIAGEYFDLQVNPVALQLVSNWLEEVADPVTGRHGYTKQGELSSRHPGGHIKQFPLGTNEALTGSSLFVRCLLGQNMEKNPIMRNSADLIHNQPPVWSPDTGHIDFYAWFWSSDAMHQVGGRHWNNWSKQLAIALLTGQSKKGVAKGSWPPIGVWGKDGGRIASTALATLSLQSHYRYVRLGR